MSLVRGMCASLAGLALVCASNVPAYGNDSEVQYVGGRLVLKKSDGIEMESEDLRIGSDLVRVKYVFRNRTDAAISTTVGFPIKFGGFGEIPDASFFRRKMGFVLKVNGVRKKATPIFERRKGVLVSVTYTWDQNFPVGTPVIVTHEYNPQGNAIGLQDGDYCPDASFERWARRAPDDAHSSVVVHYVLSTGANWLGPIRKFRLEVEKGEHVRVSMCGSGIKRTGNGSFVIEKHDFTPTSDVVILFAD